MEITNNGFQCLSCKIKELKQQNERYRKALEFYADDENYESKNATDSDYINWARPRTTKDGAWNASDMPEFKETTTLSSTEINVLTNTFGDDVESTRQFTWQMPESFSEGCVKISVNSDMSGSVKFDAIRSLTHKETASVFKVTATELAKNTTYYYQAECGQEAYRMILPLFGHQIVSRKQRMGMTFFKKRSQK